MIVGDEHTAVIAASGRLPDELALETIIIPPVAYARLELSRSLASGRQIGFGQISGPLSNLSPRQLDALFDADIRLYSVIPESLIKPVAAAAIESALDAGVQLSPMASQYVAASTIYEATIWFGHDRNVPPVLRDGLLPWLIPWRRLSELT